jgi:hypothetical protein
MPAMLVDFARKSRVHEGHRLLRRAIRHSMDTRAIDVRYSNGSVVEIDGEQLY